jgi:SAM-dependent methyltransferase
MRRLALIVLALVVARQFVRQCRKPTWAGGRFVLWGMNQGHSRLTDWGLAHVSIEPHFTMLDVGCGGGRTVHKLATLAADGHVSGIDYSESSVAASRRANWEWIETGRVDIQHASVSRLPFADRTFDLVTAVETHYYWPDLPGDMRDVLRVLKPGGRLLIIAEAYKGSRYDAVHGLVMKSLSAAYLTVEQHRDLFATAGYSEIEIFKERTRGWICAVGRRPDSSTSR